MSSINIFLIDELYNIIEKINLNKPNRYSDLLASIKANLKNLSKDYSIFYLLDDFNESIVSTEKEYGLVDDLLYIRNIEVSKPIDKLEESLTNIVEDKHLCLICREIIRNGKPLFCYRCQKLYHKECLYNWKLNQELEFRDLKCPNCKYKLEFEQWETKLDYEDDMIRGEQTLNIFKEYNQLKVQIPKLFKKIYKTIIEAKSLLKIKNKKIKINKLSLDIPNLIYEELKFIINHLKIYFGNDENLEEEQEENISDLNGNEINIIYKKGKKDEIRLFGKEFVKNNKDKCKMVINNKEYNIKEFYKLNNKDLKLKLIGIKDIISMKCIFSECENLYSLPDINKWDTKNITDMSFIFYKCSNLVELPDISKWDTSNVINMSAMFSGCKRLKSLPNIAKWDIGKVKYMGGNYKDLSSLVPLKDSELFQITKNDSKYISDTGMFFNCSSLVSLPDISKWKMKNVSNIESMFYSCSSIKILPSISSWDTRSITSLKNMFYFCSSLKLLPDISFWNTGNVTNMENIFSFCSSLKRLPDISVWNTEKVTNMENMFSSCSSLESLPDISNWNTTKVTTMEGMFSFCSSLKSLPDISKWNTSNVLNMRMMFNYCSKLTTLPDISKWNINKDINIESMFSFCPNLKSLPDISNWKVGNYFNKKFIFYSCPKKLNIPEQFISDEIYFNLGMI